MTNVRSRRLSSIPRICFIHVPKCAGVSVASTIGQQYSVIDRTLFKTFSLNGRSCAKAGEAIGSTRRDVRERVVAYMLAEDKYIFATGHFHCPPSLVTAFKDDWKFTTVLRHPVERWISGYVYDRHKSSSLQGKVDVSVEAFLESERGRYSGMTYLAYFSDIPKTPDAGDHDTFVDQAKANLDNFALVGQLERLPDFLSSFSKLSGKPLKMKHVNKTPRNDIKGEIRSNERLMQRIEEVCQPDIKLYNKLFGRSSHTLDKAF